MIAFVNGQFVPEAQAVISVLDRGFLYGDGLFETMFVGNGRPFRFAQHFLRLQQGAEFLQIRLPLAAHEIHAAMAQLIAQNGLPDCLLRLTLSRGSGVRGYSPRGADRPTVVMTVHPAEARILGAPGEWKLAVASLRLPAGEALAQFKTCNKLPQILARAEAEARGADEALLLNTNGHVVEGASSNLFWIAGQTVCTPPLASGVLPGVTRAVVLELCRDLGIPTGEASLAPEGLCEQAGVFLSLSTRGIVGALALDGQALRQSPVVARLHEHYWRRVQRETA